MSEDNEFEQWIERVEDDFENAKVVIRRNKPSIYGACFHAQQCAEKYMKAILVFKGKFFPMTHDLLILNNLLTQAGILMDITEDELDTLSSFAIATRYPCAKPTLEDAKEAIILAKTIRNFSRDFLGLN
jgi:HEPN domain-containing protein